MKRFDCLSECGDFGGVNAVVVGNFWAVRWSNRKLLNDIGNSLRKSCNFATK
jgi:hypothetical protein